MIDCDQLTGHPEFHLLREFWGDGCWLHRRTGRCPGHSARKQSHHYISICAACIHCYKYSQYQLHLSKKNEKGTFTKPPVCIWPVSWSEAVPTDHAGIPGASRDELCCKSNHDTGSPRGWFSRNAVQKASGEKKVLKPFRWRRGIIPSVRD